MSFFSVVSIFISFLSEMFVSSFNIFAVLDHLVIFPGTPGANGLSHCPQKASQKAWLLPRGPIHCYHSHFWSPASVSMKQQLWVQVSLWVHLPGQVVPQQAKTKDDEVSSFNGSMV